MYSVCPANHIVSNVIKIIKSVKNVKMAMDKHKENALFVHKSIKTV